MNPLAILLLVSVCVVAASLNDYQNTTVVTADVLDRVFIYEDFTDKEKARERWIPSRHKEYEYQPYVIKVGAFEISLTHSLICLLHSLQQAL